MRFLKVIFLCAFILLVSKTYSQSDSLTYEYFKTNLKSNMGFSQIFEIFGQPNDDLASGIYHSVYNLSDSTQIHIVGVDQRFTATHYDNKGNILHEIIGRKKEK